MSYTVYSTEDIIPIKVEGLTVYVSPLTYKQKDEIQNLFIANKAVEGVVKAMKYAIKDIDGLITPDGNKLKLKLKNGELDDKTIDTLLNTSFGVKLNVVCISLLNGLPKEFIDPQTGEPLEGVEFLSSGESKEKK